MVRRRSQARWLALQALCVFDALGDGFADELEAFLNDSHAHEDLGWSQPPPPEILTFARRLAEETWRRRERYDALLRQTATSWSIPRMPPVDRNILRLGLHELLDCPETPPEVAIDEAIELARLFADEQSPAFVNGVLDAARRRAALDAAAQAQAESPPARNGTADAPRDSS